MKQQTFFLQSLRNAYRRSFSWSLKPLILLLVLVSGSALGSCSVIKLPWLTEGCKRHTYINLVLRDYLKQRFDSQAMARMAIVPFDVPENFAPPGNDSVNYGRELARKFEAQLHQTGLVPIVELFNRDRWPGKRAEFFTGNYGAISLARAAGYDLVLVGYLEELKDDSTMNVYTKIIDTQNQITVWHAETKVTSPARALNKDLSRLSLEKQRPDLFAFPERTVALARCTVEGIEDEEPVPE